MERWLRSFNAMLVAVLFGIIGFSTSNPIIPLYLRELGITDPAALNWWTGAVNGLSNLFFALFAPIWGALADSYGRKLMLLRAMIGGAFIMGLLALTTSPWQVLVLKILQGCITGTVSASTVLTAAIVPTAQIGYRLGLLQMAIFMGNSIGPLLGGTIADLAGSRMSFLVTSALLFIASYIVFRNVDENFTPKPKSASLLRNAIPDFSALSSNSAIVALIVVVFFIQFANSVAGPIIPLVVLDMTKSLRGAGSLSGLIIGVAALGGALGAVVAGRVSGKMGYGKVLLLCIAGAFVFSLPQGFATQPWHLFVLRFFSGFFMGGTMPTANALIAAQAEHGKQGSIYGLSSAMSGAGNAAGPAFGALAASLVGYPAVFFATAAILGVLGLAVYRKVNSRIQRT